MRRNPLAVVTAFARMQPDQMGSSLTSPWFLIIVARLTTITVAVGATIAWRYASYRNFGGFGGEFAWIS